MQLASGDVAIFVAVVFGRASSEISRSFRMTRKYWWQIHEVSPSGLKLNYVWHIRQFAFALVPPLFAAISLGLLSRWKDNYGKEVLIRAEAGRSSSGALESSGTTSRIAQRRNVTNENLDKPRKGTEVSSKLPEDDLNMAAINRKLEALEKELSVIKNAMGLVQARVPDTTVGTAVNDSVDQSTGTGTKLAWTPSASGTIDSSPANGSQDGAQLAAAKPSADPLWTTLSQWDSMLSSATNAISSSQLAILGICEKVVDDISIYVLREVSGWWKAVAVASLRIVDKGNTGEGTRDSRSSDSNGNGGVKNDYSDDTANNRTSSSVVRSNNEKR
jgi:hypothetical protein